MYTGLECTANSFLVASGSTVNGVDLKAVAYSAYAVGESYPGLDACPSLMRVVMGNGELGLKIMGYIAFYIL